MLKARKWLNFPTLPLFEAAVRGNPLEFGDEIWRQKTRIVGLPEGEEILTLAFFVLTQYRLVTDGRTDGHVAIAKTRASIASRGKNRFQRRRLKISNAAVHTSPI